MATNAISKDDIKKMLNIIDTLEQDPYSFIFLEPVDHVGLGLTDYLTIVKKPMDLGTIKKKLNANKYFTVQDAIDDLNLIWTNCKLYNLEGSDIYHTAIHMEKSCKKIVDKHFKDKVSNTVPQNIKKKTVTKKTDSEIKNINNSQIEQNVFDEFKDFDDDSSAKLPFQDRCYLCERIRKLTNDGLSSLVRLIEKELPEAVDGSDPEKLEIKLTLIDKKFYDQINQLIDTYIKVKETNQENLIMKKTGFK